MKSISDSTLIHSSHSGIHSLKQPLPGEMPVEPLISLDETASPVERTSIRRRSLSSPEAIADIRAQKANDDLNNLWLYKSLVQVRRLAEGDKDFDVSILQSIKVTLRDGSTINELLSLVNDNRRSDRDFDNTHYRQPLNELAARLEEALHLSGINSNENEATLKKTAKQSLNSYKQHLMSMNDPNTDQWVSQLIHQTFHYPKGSVRLPPHEYHPMKQPSERAPSVRSEAVSANIAPEKETATSLMQPPEKHGDPKHITLSHAQSNPELDYVAQWVEQVNKAQNIRPKKWGSYPEVSPSKRRTSTPRRPSTNTLKPSSVTPAALDLASKDPRTEYAGSHDSQRHPHHSGMDHHHVFPFRNDMGRAHSEDDLDSLAWPLSEDKPSLDGQHESFTAVSPLPKLLSRSPFFRGSVGSQKADSAPWSPDTQSMHSTSHLSLSSKSDSSSEGFHEQPFIVSGQLDYTDSETDSVEHFPGDREPYSTTTMHGPIAPVGTDQNPHVLDTEAISDNGDRHSLPGDFRSLPDQEDLADDGSMDALSGLYDAKESSQGEDLSTSRTDIGEDEVDRIHVVADPTDRQLPSSSSLTSLLRTPSSRSLPSSEHSYSEHDFNAEARRPSLPPSLPRVTPSDDFDPLKPSLLDRVAITGGFSASLCDSLERLSDIFSTGGDTDMPEVSEASMAIDLYDMRSPESGCALWVPRVADLKHVERMRSALLSIQTIMAGIQHETYPINDLMDAYTLLTTIDTALTQAPYNNAQHYNKCCSFLSLSIQKSISAIFEFLSEENVQSILASEVNDKAFKFSPFHQTSTTSQHLQSLEKSVELSRKADEKELIDANKQSLEHILLVLEKLERLDEAKYRSARGVIYNQFNQAFALHIQRIEAILIQYSGVAPCDTDDELSQQFSMDEETEKSLAIIDTDQAVSDAPPKPLAAEISTDAIGTPGLPYEPYSELSARLTKKLSSYSVHTSYTLTHNDNPGENLKIDTVLSGENGADDEEITVTVV